MPIHKSQRIFPSPKIPRIPKTRCPYPFRTASHAAFKAQSRVLNKIKVNGEDAHPLYRHLTGAHPGIAEGRIGWNFTKFLIGKNGEVLARFEPKDQPKDLREAIQNALKA
jgi:glutathione peroxidase-family protein